MDTTLPNMVPRDKQSTEDLEFMDLALEMAEEALQAAEIPVGCVFVRPDEQTGEKVVIAKGRNRTNETRNATVHAEFDALSQIQTPRHPPSSPSYLPTTLSPSLTSPLQPPLNDVTLYVTIEPCIMCASALRQVGIGRVFYGASNDKFGGCGGVVNVHSDPKLRFSPTYPVFGGYRREEAILVLRRFYITENVNAPNPKKKSNRVLKTEFEPLGPPSTTSTSTQSIAGSS